MDRDERDLIATQFGVGHQQVERDHLVSHLLALISRTVGDRVHFIGGTALARTHLPSGRLSEDIDLIAVGSRKTIATEFDAAIPRALARTHGRLTLEPPLSDTADVLPTIIRSQDGLGVRIQLLSAQGRTLWPTERRALVQRYHDAPAAQLLVPTRTAFSGSKTATWADRRAARDLWDLWALNEIGAIGPAASEMYCRYGPTNQPPADYLFTSAPSETEWQTQLAGQTRLTITARAALDAVREAWRRARD